MNSTQECLRVLDQLDYYLDRELKAEQHNEVAAHLAQCPACTRELGARGAFRSRLRMVARETAATPGLDTRIRQSLHNERRPAMWQSWARPVMALAAALVVCAGVVVSYQLGHLRLTVASQNAYIAGLTQKVGYVMGIGLGDHVHCAVFRKYPKNPPSAEQMAEDMGSAYKDLIPVLQQKIPAGYRVTMAHRCSYLRRKFIHVTLTDGSRLVSLVITHKGDGESFGRATAQAVAGQQLYQVRAQRFEIAGFETAGHLVYLVSDQGIRENGEMLAAFAPGIREVLRRSES